MNMVWGIKDEYFEKVYGTSYKPKSGTGKRRVRQEKTSKPSETDADPTSSNFVSPESEDAGELQGELPIEEIEEIELLKDDGRFGGNGFEFVG